MNKLDICIAGTQFFAEASKEDIQALRRILASTNWISWSISVIDEDVYKAGKAKATELANANFNYFKKHY